MSSDDTVNAYIIDAQIALFEDARHDLQLSLAEIARQAKLPKATVDAWAQGRNMLTLWGMKKLLRVKKLTPLLSRMFLPEDCALVGIPHGLDYDEIDLACRDFSATKAAAHHPDSECQERIGPNERADLDSIVVQFPGRAVA